MNERAADRLTAMPPYSLDKTEKRALYGAELSALTQHHCERCPEYRAIVSALGYAEGASLAAEDIPMLPVRLFKEYDLRSVGAESVAKTMTSSGTTGQRTSKIYLDKENTARQTKVMAHIVGDFLGEKRLPMIILDTSAVLKDRKMFSARGAGILGFSVFGRDRIYALDEDMRLDLDGLRAFLEKHRGERVFLFGFTFMIWQYFYKELKRLGQTLELSNGVLIHGGGWKKLEQEAVSAGDFRAALREVCGIERVHNYYGMVEQLGSIYVECEHGHLHCSNFSDVLVRDPGDFSVMPIGGRGLIEVQSLLPTSYPGHVLLTEDEGEILGEDDCPCGRRGKYFKIYGRIRGAEIRGCSDTYGR